MTEPSRTSGPLSDAPWDDDDSPTSQATDASPVSRTMLRASLILLIASTLVMFLAAVASNNSVPSSSQEQIALAVHRLSMIGMLIAFFGILLAYRVSMLSEYLNVKREQQVAPDARRSLLTAETRGLLLACGLLLTWVWGSILIGIPMLHLITYYLLIIIAAVLANMVILHTGPLRSFAIGMLMSLLLILFSWRFLGTIAILYGDGFGIGLGGPATGWVYVTFGIEITVSLVAGLICAFYYEFAVKMRARMADSPAVSQLH